MIDKSRLRIAAATIIIAGLAGYVMQNGGANAARWSAAEQPQPEIAVPVVEPSLAEPGDLSEVRPTVPAIFDRPNLSGSFKVAALQDPVLPGRQQVRPLLFARSCTSELSASPADGAMARVTLAAPCHPEQRIAVSHAGLTFADVTDQKGNFSVLLPILDKGAPISVRLPANRVETVPAPDVDLAGYERMAISWDGAPGIHIHAHENGAAFGENGHVWAMRPGEPGTSGGFLIQLGNPGIADPQLAEVYTAPANGNVDLVVEAALDDGLCGRKFTATSFRMSPDAELSEMDVFVAMPSCESASGYLLLKNMFQDLKIARN